MSTQLHESPPKDKYRAVDEELWSRSNKRYMDQRYTSTINLPARRTIVWKQECSCTRKGGLLDMARTRFSIIVHSTSSSWMITSFFRILMAYNSSVPLRSDSTTWWQQDEPNANKVPSAFIGVVRVAIGRKVEISFC